MKASNRSVRCGVDARYCRNTCWAISWALALAFKVGGPDEGLSVEDAADGAVVVVEGDWAACRFGAIVHERFNIFLRCRCARTCGRMNCNNSKTSCLLCSLECYDH